MNSETREEVRRLNHSLLNEGIRMCIECGETKSIDNFSLNPSSKDGRRNQCKSCRAAYVTEYYKANKDKVIEYQAKYYSTERGKQVRKKKQQRELNDPQIRIKLQARGAVNDAVKRKKIPPARTLKCAHCGNQAKHYHHHKGYAKGYWLDVIPLCQNCHKD